MIACLELDTRLKKKMAKCFWNFNEIESMFLIRTQMLLLLLELLLELLLLLLLLLLPFLLPHAR